MSDFHELRKHKKQIMDFIFNAAPGEELELDDITMKKDFTLKDLGYEQISANYYKDEEGKIVSKAYIEELLWESITTEPGAWLS